MAYSSESSSDNGSFVSSEDDSQGYDVEYDENLIVPYSFEPVNEAISDTDSDVSSTGENSSIESEGPKRLDDLDW